MIPLDTGELVVSAPGMPDLRISLSVPDHQPNGAAEAAVSADQLSSRQVQVWPMMRTVVAFRKVLTTRLTLKLNNNLNLKIMDCVSALV